MTDPATHSHAASAQPEVARMGLRGNLAILLFVGGIIALGIRTLVTDDARYGWGTFCKQVTYDIQYDWVLQDKQGQRWTMKHWHRGELRADVVYKLSGESHNNTRYSLGAVRVWVQSYCRYMYERRDEYFPRPDPADPLYDESDPLNDEIVGFRARVYYWINRPRNAKDRDDQFQTMTFVYPLDIELPE